jgi:hypothetical protein
MSPERYAEATIDALLAGHGPLLAGVTKERDELKIMLRTVRRAVGEGATQEEVLKTLSMGQLMGAPHVGTPA